jgi:hypothetical protein
MKSQSDSELTRITTELIGGLRQQGEQHIELSLDSAHDLIATELVKDIVSGKIPAFDSRGFPLRQKIRVPALDGPNSPHITAVDGNKWLADRGYPFYWNPDDAQTLVTESVKKRRNILSPVIEQAQRECIDRYDVAEVWNMMCDLARRRQKPLYGVVEDGIQYTDEFDRPKVLRKKALSERLKRRKGSVRTDPS